MFYPYMLNEIDIDARANDRQPNGNHIAVTKSLLQVVSILPVVDLWGDVARYEYHIMHT